MTDTTRPTDTGEKPMDVDTSSVRSYEHGGRLVIEAVGPVTLGANKSMAEALRLAEAASILLITVDLRQVNFMDSSGLSLLTLASKRLRSSDSPLAPRILVTPGCQPERVLRLGMFGKILEIVYELDGQTVSE